MFAFSFNRPCWLEIAAVWSHDHLARLVEKRKSNSKVLALFQERKSEKHSERLSGKMHPTLFGFLQIQIERDVSNGFCGRVFRAVKLIRCFFIDAEMRKIGRNYLRFLVCFGFLGNSNRISFS